MANEMSLAAQTRLYGFDPDRVRRYNFNAGVGEIEVRNSVLVRSSDYDSCRSLLREAESENAALRDVLKDALSVIEQYPRMVRRILRRTPVSNVAELEGQAESALAAGHKVLATQK